MIGQSGVWKSRLAMWIAAGVADNGQLAVDNGQSADKLEDADERTTPSAEDGVHPSLVRRGAFGDSEPCPLAEANGNGVLYLDLERTWRQYLERYSDIDGALANVDLGLLGDVPTPERYRGKRHKFLVDAVNAKLREGHPVVIIDNLAWLVRSEFADIRLLMKGFRRWVNETRNSLLVLWHSSPVQPLALQAERFDLADSVFALKASTMGENIRYVKSVKDSGRWSVAPSQSGKLVFDLRREVMVLRSDHTGGFVPVGVSREAAHHRDYASVALAAKQAASEAKALLPLAVQVPKKRVTFFEISEGESGTRHPSELTVKAILACRCLAGASTMR